MEWKEELKADQSNHDPVRTADRLGVNTFTA